MKVRTIKEEDKETFMTLCKEFYEAGATCRGWDYNLAQKTFDYLITSHHNLWGYFIICEDDNKPAGYALLTSYWCNEDGGEIIILDELYVNPQYRHHGYGKRFLEWSSEHFKGKAVSITLEVLTTNTIAKELYSKLGYANDGFEVMTKKLN